MAVMGWGVLQLVRNKLWLSTRFLKLLTWSIPLPLAAIQFGWVTAEVGRQPWIVYGEMKTRDAFSMTVPAAHVLFSLIMFSLIYLMLLGMYLFLLRKKVMKGPQPAQ